MRVKVSANQGFQGFLQGRVVTGNGGGEQIGCGVVAGGASAKIEQAPAHADVFGIVAKAGCFQIGSGKARAIADPAHTGVHRRKIGRPGLAQSLFQVGGNVGSALGPVAAAFVVLRMGQRGLGTFSVLALVSAAVLVRVDALPGLSSVTTAEESAFLHAHRITPRTPADQHLFHPEGAGSAFKVVIHARH